MTSYEIKDAFLKNASYVASLDSDIFIASYPSKLVIGKTCFDNYGQLVFSSKAIAINSEKFQDFAKILYKAKNAYETNSKESFEEPILRYSPVRTLMGVYNEYEGTFKFSLRIRWTFAKDRRYLDRVSLGLMSPITVSPEDKDHIFLQRGNVLDQHQLELLCNQFQVVLEHTALDLNEDSRNRMKGFIDFVDGNKECLDYLKSKYDNFSHFSYKDKAEVLDHLLSKMAAALETGTSNGQNFQHRLYNESLSNKHHLLFALFTHFALKGEKAV